MEKCVTEKYKRTLVGGYSRGDLLGSIRHKSTGRTMKREFDREEGIRPIRKQFWDL